MVEEAMGAMAAEVMAGMEAMEVTADTEACKGNTERNSGLQTDILLVVLAGFVTSKVCAILFLFQKYIYILLIQTKQGLADGFARFSNILDANFDALYGSFSSVAQLLEHFSNLRREIFYAFQAFTVFGIIRKIWSSWFGVPPPKFLAGGSEKGSFDITSFKKFEVCYLNSMNFIRHYTQSTLLLLGWSSTTNFSPHESVNAPLRFRWRTLALGQACKAVVGNQNVSRR